MNSSTSSDKISEIKGNINMKYILSREHPWNVHAQIRVGGKLMLNLIEFERETRVLRWG
jgi:hypothetical protein